MYKEAETMPREAFLKRLKEYNPNANLELIGKAYDVAIKAHEGQKRHSGAPYFIHPQEVAKLLMELKADSATICAALLHDVVEDTKITNKDIASEFGQEIADLVDGVTKIKSIDFDTREDYTAENIRKIILATAKDVRVILIKLCDKLHNMYTCRFLERPAQERMAHEVLDIYAPIAYKLGIHRIKAELEDKALKILDPDAYYQIKGDITMRKEERDSLTINVIQKIRQVLESKSIVADVYGRTKHFYSIYKKMKKKNKKLDELHDLIAIRIITHTKEDCYMILGLIHAKWRPIPGGFEDYIANPKPNGYQSIHTEIYFDNTPVEIQIRTIDMHYTAEDGIAAHWRYKDTDRDKYFEQKITWLKHILKWRQDSDAKEFIESLKVDLFGHEIVVFTPKGDPINLIEGSTPVDFAYHVHTDIGRQCSKAKVNGNIVPLDAKLNSGDIIEIITSKSATPSRNWLKFVKSSLAKSEIRQALHIKGIDREGNDDQMQEHLSWKDIVIDDPHVKGAIKVSKCCGAKPGDEILAFLTKDKKITIHKVDCPNKALFEKAKEIKVHWALTNAKKVATLVVFVKDRVGLLADILNVLAAEKINIRSINTDSVKDKIKLNLQIEYSGKETPDQAVQLVKNVKNVLAVNLHVS